MRTGEKAWDYVWTKLFSDKTNLIYDNPIKGVDEKDVFSLPTPEEISLNLPNACGWNTGMEDSMISFGRMLDSVVIRYELSKDNSLHEYAAKLLDGAVKCATISGSDGFLARSISPYDCKSFYSNSSRDQYTHCAYSLSKYLHCGMCTADERATITDVLVSFARRAEKYITAENKYHYMCADEKVGLVDQMWGNIWPEEIVRLPFIYLAAYDASHDEKWLVLYKKHREHAVTRAYDFVKSLNYVIVYQMSISLALMWRYETEKEYKDKYLELLGIVADTAENFVLETAETVKNEKIDFSEKIMPWRERSFGYELLAPISGRGYFVPQLNDKHNKEFLMLFQSASAYEIQAICPGRVIPKEQTEAFEYIVNAVNYDKHMSRAITVIVEACHLGMESGNIKF